MHYAVSFKDGNSDKVVR